MSVIGKITWQDLTVTDAEMVRDFYAKVVGWRPEAVNMRGYSDFCMSPSDGEAVAGICHARGPNVHIPPQWLIYINVEDLDSALVACKANGGSIVVVPRPLMGGRMCVIRDPAGAVCALFQP